MIKHSLLIAACALLLFSCNNRSTAQETPPNVLFILVDDLGWKDLGVYGSEFYDTPNLDRLAGQGLRFTDAYAASSVCSPTRAALMTGKDPVRVNITDWIPGSSAGKDAPLSTPEDIHELPLDEITIAEAFQAQGYKTFYAGKWHLGETPEYWPENQGFEINKGGHDKGSPPGGYYSPYENPRLGDGPEGEYLTDRLTDESIKFMEERAGSGDPFFLYLSYYTVHTPIQGAAEFDSLYQARQVQLPGQGEAQTEPEHEGLTRVNQSDAKYAAMVRSLDKNVGRLMERLEELNLTENTIIVFTSDNGGLTTKKTPGPTAVRPLRAGKGWLYEGGIRIPLIIRGPEIAKGAVSSEPAVSMDLYPTLLALSGLPAMPEQHMDGMNLSAYLQDPAKKDDRVLVWHYPHYHGSTWTPGSAIRKGPWKLIEFYESNTVELYNLENDISEKTDLAEKYPEKAAELRSTMHAYIKERGGNYPERK